MSYELRSLDRARFQTNYLDVFESMNARPDHERSDPIVLPKQDVSVGPVTNHNRFRWINLVNLVDGLQFQNRDLLD